MQGQGAENVTAADVPRRTRAGGACWPPTDTRRLAAFSHRSPRVASPRVLPRRGPHLHSQASGPGPSDLRVNGGLVLPQPSLPIPP